MSLLDFAWPRRNSINAEGKYTQKPRVMKMNLFNFHYRGATVYADDSPNSAETESNASLLAIAEAL